MIPTYEATIFSSRPAPRARGSVALAAAALGAVHGAFEVVEGATPPPGLRFCATGGAWPEHPGFATMSRCLPTQSLLPNYLAAGVATLLVAAAMALFVWTRLERRGGGLGMLALSVALLAAGGDGFAPLAGLVVGVLVLRRPAAAEVG